MDTLRKEFEDTALPYMDEIHKAALRMTKNVTEAEDLVQDTFLRAYRFFNKFEQGTCMRAWLLKILKNTYINRFNKQVNKPEHVDFDQLRLYEEEPTSTNDPEKDIMSKAFDDDLMRAINELPTEFGTVILLSDLEGFSYREIAKIVKCPIGTVMSRLHRGRKLLRYSLKEYAEEFGYVYS
jgi:RNA polymerase sigma-70 factor, ECF subfamily